MTDRIESRFVLLNDLLHQIPQIPRVEPPRPYDFLSPRGIELRIDRGGFSPFGATVGSRNMTFEAMNGQKGSGACSKKVLIVEDNDLNMKLFNDLLEAHGYTTLQTSDGVEALKLARQHRPDLILMDIQLPEISGLEVTKWLKEDDELRSIPVIAVTAFAMKGDEEKIRGGGCEAYIAKPISVASFLRTVERFLA
jgi:two-component system, cell cycle response regulator DivK